MIANLNGSRRRIAAACAGIAALCGCVGLSVASVRDEAEPQKFAQTSARNLLPSGWDSRPVPFRSSGRIDYDLLQARIARLMAGRDMVGLGVAVIEDGQFTFVKGFGTTVAGGIEPVGVHTVFRWASLSKGVAATMVGELAAEGRVGLMDPVDRYSRTLKLPDGNEDRATVADLLSHRLGIVHNAYDDRLEQGYDPRVIRTQLAFLKPFCPPGQCHTYQNVAFDAASEIVERVSGESYASEVEDRLFGPLGMSDSSLTRLGLVTSPSWARPHVGRTVIPVAEAYYRVPAAGGVNSSIFDLGRWMQAQMGARPLVLPAGLLNEIHRPRVLTDKRRTPFNQAMGQSEYALGWRDYNYHGHALVGHQGAVAGYRSAIIFDPVLKTGIALLWNSQTGRPMGIQLEILDMLYGEPRRDWMKVDEVEAGPGALAD